MPLSKLHSNHNEENNEYDCYVRRRNKLSIEQGICLNIELKFLDNLENDC